jgi:ethanolaminephosphotransferase
MTFVGWLLVLSNVIVLWVYNPNLGRTIDGKEDVVPTWVWIWCAFAQFLGHQLDGCDGTQARRTKTSSPIGKS